MLGPAGPDTTNLNSSAALYVIISGIRVIPEIALQGRIDLLVFDILYLKSPILWETT